MSSSRSGHWTSPARGCAKRCRRHCPSFEIVEEAVTAAPSEDWVAVALANGQTGDVAERLARSPLACRATFEHSGGRWQMTMFIAGD